MGKGEIWLANIPEGAGHEQAGQRPAILYSGPTANIVIIIPLTKTIERAQLPFTEIIKACRTTNGLDCDSVALVFQIRSIDSQRLLQKIGKIDQSEIQRIDGQITGLFRL